MSEVEHIYEEWFERAMDLGARLEDQAVRVGDQLESIADSLSTIAAEFGCVRDGVETLADRPVGTPESELLRDIRVEVGQIARTLSGVLNVEAKITS